MQQVKKDKGPVAMEMDKEDSMKAEEDEDAQIYSKVSDIGLKILTSPHNSVSFLNLFTILYQHLSGSYLIGLQGLFLPSLLV